MAERFIRTRLPVDRLNPVVLIPGERRPIRPKTVALNELDWMVSEPFGRKVGDPNGQDLPKGTDPIQLLTNERDRDIHDSQQNKSRLDIVYDSDNPFVIFLREIGPIPLLTAAEEVSLAQQMEAARKAKLKLVPEVEERVGERNDPLQLIIDAGELARKKLIESNLKLVVAVAKKYLGRGLPLSDLVSEGYSGLERGVDKFDWRKGFRFSTYAYWWIRQAVSRGVIEQGRTIRLPVHVAEYLGDIYRSMAELQNELGRDPKVEEVAAKVGLSPENIEEYIKASQQPISLETPVGQEVEQTLGDFIEDRSLPDMDEQVFRSELRERVASVLDSLPARERWVLKFRFGLGGDGKGRTLQELADMFGVTRERIRQIESKALRKLRYPSRANELREYFK